MKQAKYLLLATLIAVLICFFNLPIVTHAHVPTEGTRHSPSLLAINPGQFATFIEADGLYRQGEFDSAAQLYRQVKPAFANHPITEAPAPVYEATSLSATNLTTWNNAQAALESENTELAVSSLQQVATSQPEFIPGVLQLAEQLNNSDREDEAIELLDGAATLYPGSADVVMAQVQTLAAAGEHIEASIAAREFAILHLDHPQAGDFEDLAEDEFKAFSKKRKRDSIIGGVTNIVVGIFTGNKVPWESWDSAVDTYEVVDLMLSNEKRFGAKAAEQYVEQLSILEDPEVTDYVTQLGMEVARPMGRDFDYEFYVVQDNTMNAFALPGGKIFVNTGLIRATRSQAELAGVLAHEAAHSVLSHGIQGFFRDDTLSQLGEQVPFGDFVTTLISLNYSRQQERQSDILGTRVLSTAGYAADGLRNFMATLTQNTSSPQIEYFSTHPTSAARVTYLEELIQRNGYNRYALEGVDKHSEIQQRLS